MFICPTCKVPLAKTKGSPGVFWRCPSCDGRSATISLLRKVVPVRLVNELWQSAGSGGRLRKRVCPACNHRMAEVPAHTEEGVQYLDVCTVCQFVWFDKQEYAALPVVPKKPSAKDLLPPEAREKLALMEIERIRAKAQDTDLGEDAPDAWWQWIPAVLGMPVEHDAERLRSLPWLTWGIALLITAVSVAAFFDLESVVAGFGLVPAHFDRLGGLTFLTAFLLHGGIYHLLGNQYFLLVFGDNVEDWLGRWRYFLLLVSATVVGDVAHILGDPDSLIPCIGASGGISGVLAFYALTFPKAKLGFMVRIYAWFRWVRMPAYLLFLAWVAIQLLGTWSQLAGFSHVSYLAHLGGAGVGVGYWLVTRKGS